jgi:adrenodoxin-NADP+ reductase
MKSRYLLKVKLFEKIPTPFGLIRDGVALDHPEIRRVESTFAPVACDGRFKFFGNATVGKDVTIKRLKEDFRAIVFAYGV